jgi:hypothetical protein
MKAKLLLVILTFTSTFLLSQSQDLSFIDQNKESNFNTGEYTADFKTTDPDSTGNERAARAASDLLNAAVSKLHTLSNIDEKGTAVKYFDKIITFDNEVLIVKVQHITLTEVSFLYPFNTKTETINRQKVSQILYADNRIDLFTPFEEEKKELLPIQEERLIVYRREQWEKIHTTENINDVAGFEKIGPVSAVFEADQINSSHKFLEKNGMIIIKKRAARLQADMILITNKSVHRGYGDFPNIKIEGIAYKK